MTAGRYRMHLSGSFPDTESDSPSSGTRGVISLIKRTERQRLRDRARSDQSPGADGVGSAAARPSGAPLGKSRDSVRGRRPGTAECVTLATEGSASF